MKRQQKRNKPQPWQLEASRIETENVQVWANGVMRGVIVKEAAVERVQMGGWFVMCSQAIGMLDENGCYSS